MRIILIRHGNPDYANDSLTEKGIREATLLAQRVARWEGITQFYCSPLGRAQETASYSLKRCGREAITCDWMREFAYLIDDPVTGRHGVPWDFMPEYWTNIPKLYEREGWKKAAIYRSNPELLPAYDAVCQGLDSLLSEYGYRREKNVYRNENPVSGEADSFIHVNPGETLREKHDTIVIFCHLGVACMMMSHLLGISPALLCHTLFLAPTSVTVLATEERMNRAAIFRAQVIGDTCHLLQGGEPVSGAGYFTEPFQG